MSYHGDGHRRYGHVPPAQYPVSSHQQPHSQVQQQDDLGRSASLNNGDDRNYYSNQGYQQRAHAPSFTSNASGGAEDELFLSNAAGVARNASYHQAPQGYQQQYQDHATPPTPQQSYNPQMYQQRQGYPPSGSSHTPSPTNFTPQTYNPAAYANTASSQRQTAYGYGIEQGHSPSMNHGPSPGPTYSPAFSQQSHASGSYQAPYPPGVNSPSLGTGFSNQPPASAGYDPSQYAPGQYAGHPSNGSISSQSYTQIPYPSSPSDTTYTTDQQSYFDGSRTNSQVSVANSYTTYSQSGLSRHPTNAPLPSRPGEYSRQGNYDSQDQALLMQDIEAELGAISSGTRTRIQQSADPNDQLNRHSSHASATGRQHLPASQSQPARMTSFLLDDYGDDDPEAAAGAQALTHADLEERRASGSALEPPRAPSTSLTPALPEEPSQTSDGQFSQVVDLGVLGGSFEPGGFSYGDDVGSPQPPPAVEGGTRPLPSPQSPQKNTSTAPYPTTAEIDYGDTGGLQPPTKHRLSFDEGSEVVSIHSQQSREDSPPKDDYQDLFYHPGLTNRPLPAIPPTPASDSSSLLSVNTNARVTSQHQYSNSTDSRFYQPDNPEAYYSPGAAYNVPPERSISLSGHGASPQVVPPARSRTDATEERRKVVRQQQGQTLSPQQGGTLQEYDTNEMGAFGAITLPTGRKRRFIPSKLSPGDFRRCTEPWALSGIEAWIRELADGEQDLRIKTIEEALVHLFTAKVATMNVADAEALSARVVADMLHAFVLVPDEEWVKFGNGHISGVLWQMSGAGCYSPKVHEPETQGRCYSYHCTRTLKKIDLNGLNPDKSKPTDEWHVFYSLKKEDIESRPKKEVDRQNILHEIVTGEENYIKQLELFRTLYRDDLRVSKPPVIHPERQGKFFPAVFGKLDTVVRINKENLLAQLKYRQQEQGPWIIGVSDLFREWIRKARSDYIEYATAYPRAVYMVRNESERNVLFRRFLEEKQKHASALKQDWRHFLITPVQRLQRYTLLLESSESKMLVDSEEKTNLQKAIQEIKAVTLECDAKVAEANKRVEMLELDRMLMLRPGSSSVLNLTQAEHQLLMQGELTRLSSKALRWVDTHVMLFDHYFILAKTIYSRDGRDKKYDVSKEPIPMPVLFLESMNDEPIQRQKGITTLARTTTATQQAAGLSKVATNGSGRPGLEHAATNSSLGSGQSDEGRVLYPFRIKHLGYEIHTLYATSARERMEWCNKILEAKENYAKALFAQNAEPFHLRVLADAAFHYDSASAYARTSSVPVKGTPLDRAIQDIESVLGSGQGIAPVCRAQVNCAAAFSAFGKSVIAIGTDYGVFISTPSNPRGWTRTVQANRVTQIAVLEEFSVCLIIADKSLISYPLDVVAPVSDFAAPTSDNTRRAPQRLSKDVTYFATARMKDRMLLFYKRREGLHTTFKVVEPIYQKANEKRRLFGRKSASGNTESFRDFDEFFFPNECFSLSLFQSYIAVATSKGIEMLTLDKKHPMSIPDTSAPAIANIASRIKESRPIGMFRLNENEFVLVYDDCAVYVDKHGEVSRTLVQEYGRQKKAKGATMYGQYLILFNDDHVEVRNAENGRLRQIIAGKDVRALDYGVRGPTGTNAQQAQQTQGRNGALPNVDDTSKGTVKIAMCHPELPGRQIVLEMLLNDGHKE